jgi:hypothetical protein
MYKYANKLEAIALCFSLCEPLLCEDIFHVFSTWYENTISACCRQRFFAGSNDACTSVADTHCTHLHADNQTTQG